MSSDARNLPPFRLKLPGLTILWVNRARHLAQALLRVSIIQRFDELPPDMMVVTRKSVRLLLDNMVTLGKASVKYGPYRDRIQPDFFVPSEATTLFGLAEGFVDLFGFEGDEDAARRRAIFGNLELLYSCMLLNPLYADTGVDFPGFDLDIRTLVLFGVTPWIKPSQLARVLPGSRAAKHNFGDDLLRYHPELGEAGRFVLALGDEDYTPTQPNTPELGELSVIIEEEEGDLSVYSQNPGGFSLVDSPGDEEDGEIPGMDRPCDDDKENDENPAGIPGYEAESGEILVGRLSTPEPENSSSRGTIFKYSSRLAKLSLHPQELECYTLQPQGSWLEFLEKRVRPMIYFLHAGVTHDFTLVGRKGYYGREEFAEIWYWMERVFLHLRLLLLSHCDTSSQYSGGWGLPFPSACEIPGEATAMFEILYHLCLSVGFPDIQGMELPINRHTLLPLICEARRTRAHFKTPVEFQPYNSFGGLDDPSFLTLEGW
ncbi:hypothetical protein DFH09DRAFT_1091328 [Mycena vulgaris]|nr:hypothetical protein DFH09DRAFT_1091328 [Mycena vulgaris]